MQYRFATYNYGLRFIAPSDADINRITVIPYFYAGSTVGTNRLHTHDFWEICFVIKGTLLHEINGKKYELHERDILLIKPQDNHRVYDFMGSGAEFYNFEVRESFFRQYVESIDKKNYELLLNNDNVCVKCDEIMYQKLHNTMNIILSISSQQYTEKQRYLQILIAKIVCEMLSDKVWSMRKNHIIEKRFDYMRNPENMRSSLVDLAEFFGYSRENILRIFKRNGYDLPSMEWKKVKLMYASNLLLFTDKSIIDISYEIGIVNSNYFTKIFKDFFGLSPSQYRKMYSNGKNNEFGDDAE